MSEKQQQIVDNKINIGQWLSPEKAKEINDLFEKNPKKAGNEIKNMIEGTEESKKEELASNILVGINKCDTHFDTEENIGHFLTLLNNLKTLDPNIDQAEEWVENPYLKLKTQLEDKKQNLEKDKKQKETQTTQLEQWWAYLTTILNSPNNTPELLLQSGKLLFEQNKASYDVLFNSEQIDALTTTQQENLKKIILTYALWGKDIDTKIDGKPVYTIPASLDKARFKTDNLKYPTWTKIIQIPQKDIIGDDSNIKVYEIAFWTTDQLHQARTDKIASYADTDPNSLKSKTETPDGKPLGIASIIEKLDGYWSYKAFKAFLDKQDAKYLQQNFGSILPAIETENIKYEWSEDKINGYCRAVAERVKDLATTGDTNTLKVYLQFVNQTPAYLWTESKNKIDTRNIIAKRWDANILKSEWNDELKALYIKTKMQIDPNWTKKEILEQVDDAMDKFFEQYGGIIAQVVDFFGGKGTFMKYLPDNLKEKFRVKFKEKFQMNEQQTKNFTDINKELNTIDDTKQTDANTAIEGLKKDATEKTKIKSILTKEENFKKLSPNLIANIIKEHNKKPGEKLTIEISDFITVDAKGKPETIKPGDETWREIIVDKLLDKWSTIRSTIKSTYNEVTTNAQYDFSTKDKSVDPMDINGSSVDKGIQSYRDVATYIAAYVTTGWQPPFKQVISENDIVETSKSHSIKKPEGSKVKETPKNPEQLHIEDITNINDIITKGKYKNSKNEETDFPIDYNGTNHAEYQLNVIQKLSLLFSDTNKLTEPNTAFIKTTKNIDKLKALQSTPQVLKDLISYTASKETDQTKKIIIEWIATSLIEIKKIEKIEKQADWNILVQIDSKTKFIIKPGPIFEPTV